MEWSDSGVIHAFNATENIPLKEISNILSTDIGYCMPHKAVW